MANSVDHDGTARYETTHLDLQFEKVSVLVCSGEKVKEEYLMIILG